MNKDFAIVSALFNIEERVWMVEHGKTTLIGLKELLN